MATMNISLPEAMKAFVESQVATGQYANSSDYVRDLIRYDQRELDLIRAAVAEGEASGDSGMTPDQILAELLEKHAPVRKCA